MLGNGELFHRGRLVDVQMHGSKQFLSRLIRLLLVEEYAAEHGLFADKDILGNREMRHEVELLMDHSDAALLRVERAVELDLFALVDDLSAVFFIDTVEHLHQCRFSRSVFTNQCVNLTIADIKAGIIQRMHAGEILLYILHLK